MEQAAARDAAAARLQAEMAEVCGIINAATGRLVGLIATVLETDAWHGAGIRPAEQWVPETRAALEAGELAEDQVAVVCAPAPAHVDAEVAQLARLPR